MKILKKYKYVFIFSLILIAIIFLKYKELNKDMKIENINNLVESYKSGSESKVDVMTELSKKYTNDNSVKEEYEYALNLISEIENENSIYERISKDLEHLHLDYLGDWSRMNHINDLKEITSNSKYYDEATDLLTKLGGNRKDENTNNGNSPIELMNHTRHSTAGLQELEIKVKNVSGNDIEYLAIDIFEINKNGDIINSDYTNTSALVKDDATVLLDTYFDYQGSESDLEFEIRDIRYK